MNKFGLVVISVVALLGGFLIVMSGIQSGWSNLASAFLLAPYMLSAGVAAFTVMEYGSPEQQREAAASFLVYGCLAIFTGAAYLIGETAVRDKYVDALLFGQVVPLLSIAKLCILAWANPTAPETVAEHAARLENARSRRRAIRLGGKATKS